MKISAVILTKNEERNIKECIDNLKFCDEIVVVDDVSIDKTVEIASKSGTKVFNREMNMDFAGQSNFGMKKAAGEWILFIDADERVTPELQEEIIVNLKNINSRIKGFRFRRIDFMWNRWLTYGESGNSRVIRLVRKDSGLWRRRVHPTITVNGIVIDLKNPLLHYPHRNLNKFIDSINRWSTWHALANKEEGKKSNLIKIVLMPPSHFLKNYIFKFGFLDGMPGFVYALVMAAHSYLAWSKLLLLQKKVLK